MNVLEVTNCPCHLTYEYIINRNKLDDDDFCKAFYADKSVDQNGNRKVCGEHLSKHPREILFQQQAQKGSNLNFLFLMLCEIINFVLIIF